MELGMLADMGWTLSGGGSGAARGNEGSGSAGSMLTQPGRMVEHRAQRVTTLHTSLTHVFTTKTAVSVTVDTIPVNVPPETPSGTRLELGDYRYAQDSLQTAWAIDQILNEAEPIATRARHADESLTLYDLIAEFTDQAKADQDSDETEALDLVLQLEDEWRQEN